MKLKGYYRALLMLLLLAGGCEKGHFLQFGSSGGEVYIIPNHDFEFWTQGDLFHWTSNNCPMCVSPFETHIIRKDSQHVYHGNYSAMFIYNNVYPTWASVGFPITRHPASLTAYIQNQLWGTDSASISIRLFKNNVAVDSGKWVSAEAISIYSPIIIPISQHQVQVDSGEVKITFGNVKLGISGPGGFSKMWVDYLVLK